MGTVLSIFSALFILSCDIGMDNSFKAYMDYRYLTNQSSIQYQMQQEAWTDHEGFRRLGDKYMVALGSYYTDYICGEPFIIVFEDNTFIQCVIGDMKADIHTDSTNRYQTVNSELGSIVEFIVDTDTLLEEIIISGDCNYRFPGQIKYIVRESDIADASLFNIYTN